MGVLDGLKPEKVFKFFEEISMIPRCSGNEKAISDYLVKFAKERNLEYIQDDALNVIIKKPATPGYENVPGVIIQGHIDMVCEKTSDSNHDFSKDPLKLQIDGDFIKATNTTLGADNGIAVAYALAILDSDDIEHPYIEVLMTTEEETGMGGANALDPELLKGKVLLNIDSEEEGIFYVSCAGGLRDIITLPIEFMDAPSGFKSYEIKVFGLQGGHSGMEIIKQRGNANKLLGRVLYDLNKKIEVYGISIDGGDKSNAIPREATAKILAKDKTKLIEIIDYWKNVFKNEFSITDPDVELSVNEIEHYNKVMTKDSFEKAINILMLVHDGIQTMSKAIEGLVESSSNLGVVKTFDNRIEFTSATRSSVETLRDLIHNKAEIIAKLNGAKITTNAPYPAWEYKKDSKIRELMKKVYKDMYGKEPEITAIHAGLECGILSGKMKDVDMISFGPNIYGAHTPEEKLSISSTQRVWEFLLNVLKEMKNY
ncbi:aminoacyl-histidine dipeptidase [Marinitoga sp. 1135]|uniref:aminoacyl-histidine dipeptidase n=1 Tax=unclassified Marinitoga TaxID=2640159 RepID=UPI000950507E|nr:MULTISPECIES: aminoacyl-histidine dipeptidase [unclassified Marinitoga]APT75847.1 aminoacyl-histidine dipeptidase [Marinitoga sp. 1137]NUU95618.1 aminoacyl-histidine dipeptidase [Marinitoga sp. 1135]